MIDVGSLLKGLSLYGGTILHNELANTNKDCFEEDLLQIEYDDYILDLGYYNNKFRVLIICKKQNSELQAKAWDEPIFDKSFDSLEDAIKAVQEAVYFIKENYDS